MDIKTLGVVGAGQMGSGIAQVAAASGLSVLMSDIKEEFVERGFSAIDKSLGRIVKKGSLSEEDKGAPVVAPIQMDGAMTARYSASGVIILSSEEGYCYLNPKRVSELLAYIEKIKDAI